MLDLRVIQSRAVVAISAAAGVVISGLFMPVASAADQTRRPTGHVWTNVSTGSQHSCGVRLDHTLWCWGSNGASALGLGYGHWEDEDRPTQVGTDSNWRSVRSGESHTCGLRIDGTLWCWGWNGFGQVGVGSHDTVIYEPSQVGSDTDWSSVALGYGHTCATRTDGTLWCWGRNSYGELGIGEGARRKLSPVQVGSDTDWAAFDGEFPLAHSFTCALKLAGTAWCWGNNESGQLGLGDHKRRYLPTQLPGADWTALTPGGTHACGLRSDGTLWCWGANGIGQLGIGGTRSTSTPVQVGTDADWARVDAGQEHTCAIRHEGTLWCWGSNIYGSLGLGDVRRETRPTQVGVEDTWSEVRAGGTHTCAVRTHHTLWCFGRNYQGQLGLGDHGDGTDRQLPTRV